MDPRIAVLKLGIPKLQYKHGQWFYGRDTIDSAIKKNIVPEFVVDRWMCQMGRKLYRNASGKYIVYVAPQIVNEFFQQHLKEQHAEMVREKQRMQFLKTIANFDENFTVEWAL